MLVLRTRRLCPLTASLFSAKSFSAVHVGEKIACGLEEHEVRGDGKLPEAGEAGKIWGGVDEGGFQPWQGARVPLNGWQQAAVAAGSAVGALMNPARADLVAALGETTGSVAFRRILVRMKQSADGQKVLLNRPRVTSTSMAQAWDMPPNTFGGAYAKFMGDRNFSPDDRPPVRFVESEDLAYIATRSREVHDLWHVLFNLPTSGLGELALKMVEFHQTGIPMCFFAVAGASWRLKPQQRNSLFTHYAPWALRAGVSASDLMCIYYEQHLQEDLDEVISLAPGVSFLATLGTLEMELNCALHGLRGASPGPSHAIRKVDHTKVFSRFAGIAMAGVTTSSLLPEVSALGALHVYGNHGLEGSLIACNLPPGILKKADWW